MNIKRSQKHLVIACTVAALAALAASASERVLQHKAAQVTPIEAPGLHNLFALGTNIFSGSAPDGEDGFTSLEKLGIKTIITVDGTKPDVAGARRHGIRYVHLPHGYDGISREIQLLLAKAGRELAGPIYVHCHHGKHRGPTAAAVICMADQGWSAEEATAFLKAAGTATNYAGLYETVHDFKKPTDTQLEATPDHFPEIATISGLVDAMVEIDGLWDHLKAIRAAGYHVPPDQPDLDPANEAVILWEHFREAQRLPEAIDRGPDVIDRLKKAEAEAKEAERLLRSFVNGSNSATVARLDRTFDSITQSCAACHKRYRDPAGIKSEN